MQKILVISFLLFNLIACNNGKSTADQDAVDYTEFVKTLQDMKAKKAFLQGIYSFDQETKRRERQAVVVYGFNSAEHLEAKKELDYANGINLEKVEAYLSVYGYPDKQKMKTNSVNAPYNVILDLNDVDVKRRNFPYMLAAYKNGDLPGSSLSLYLNKLYELEKGERMRITGAFVESFELDTLINSLGLD